MKKILVASLFLLFVFQLSLNSQDTFSIVAIDTLTGEIGSAGASCIGAPTITQGCYILSDVLPGIGAIHTQAYYLSQNQNYAHSLMLQQIPPEDIIDSVVANDYQNNPTIRQYGIVDFYTGSPRSAAFTGSNCDDYKNHITGPNYAIQGNILLGQQILDSMEARFLAADGHLACRLMEALQGAKVIGADTRCLDDGVSSLSAFLRVAQPDDPTNDLYVDLNVPSTPDGIDPIDSLQTLIDIWGGCLLSGSGNAIESSSIMVFPNPAHGDVNIILSETGLAEGEFVIYDLMGNKASEMKALSGSRFSFQLDLQPGLYYFKILNKGQLVKKGKLMIN